MRAFGGAIVIGVLVLVLLSLARWAVADAKRRGKPAILVMCAVVLFFPWGLIAWLLFRPKVPADAVPRAVRQ